MPAVDVDGVRQGGGPPSPSGAGGSRAARFSATVRPVTVRQSPCSSPASSSSRMTTGTPPMRSRSTMWYFPWGLVSARWGTRAATLLKSSSARSTRASLAMASRWSTALVDPPEGHHHGDGVLEGLPGHDLAGPDPRGSSSTTARPDGRRASSRRRSTAGADELPGSDMPEGLGHRRHGVGGEHAGARALGGARVVLDQAELLVAQRVHGVGPHRLEHAERCRGPGRRTRPGQDRPSVEEDAGQVEPGRGHQHARAATCRTRRR